MTARLYEGAAAALIGFAPLFLLVALAAILAPMLVSGWLFTFQALQPDFSRLNPLNGLKRILSWHGAIELGKALLKTLLIGGVAAWVVWVERGGDRVAARRAGRAGAGAPRQPARPHLPRHRRGFRLDRRGGRAVPDLGPPSPAAHDQGGGAPGAQGDRGRPAAQGAHPQPAARGGAPPDDGRGAQGRRGGHQPRSLRGRAALRRAHHARAAGGGEGLAAGRRAHRRGGPRQRRADPARAAAGAGAVRACRGRPGDPGRAVQRGGRGAGVGIPAASLRGRRRRASARAGGLPVPAELDPGPASGER